MIMMTFVAHQKNIIFHGRTGKPVTYYYRKAAIVIHPQHNLSPGIYLACMRQKRYFINRGGYRLKIGNINIHCCELFGRVCNRA